MAKIENTKEKYAQDYKSVPVIAVEGAGVPEKGVKTDGVKTRGNGAAIKGIIARGPMA
jgi:hypothetical protein